ncbi:NACHT domain-containing NTPase [Microcoleus sp. CAWBG58]|uniref:NACHT domain-containing protein n=1 Tax=Microcoleus sp. CAWBG58 TaxID=2841651 RepID=UPI0025FE888A|nr:NACHT domain-containing protein [Microcoleus sp. CAWBG58]
MRSLMPTFIQNWLLPFLLILSNGFLGWLINQLPGKQDLKIDDPIIILLTAVCLLALFILGFISSQSQSSATPANQNSLVGFLPLLGGGILFGLLKANYVPAEFNPAVFYTSLVLFGLGTVLPPVLLLPRQWQNRLVWFPPGLGLAVMFYFLLRGQWTAGFLALVVTVILTLFIHAIKFLIPVTNQLTPRFRAKRQEIADIFADSIWNKFEDSTSSFQREYYQGLTYICRDYQTQGLDKDRTLNLQKVFVPLKIAATEAANISHQMIQPPKDERNNSNEIQIWNFLAAIDKHPAFRRMAVLGAAGSGKTTLLRHLTLTYATKQQQKVHRNAPKLIPVLLYLRDVRQEIVNNQPPLAELITQQVQQQRAIQPLNPPPNWFAEKLRQNQCLVMLDGLDEVADETQRQKVSRWVDEQMQNYADTAFILTSRPSGYKDARLQQDVTVLAVQPFNLKQMEQFISGWYLETEVMSRAGLDDIGVQEEAKKQADDLIKRIKNSKPLADMAVNPLLLTMIATVHRRGSALPGKRVELYKEICQLLLEKRQRAKNIADALTATQKQSVLQVLAFELMQQKTREFKLSDGINLIKNKLADVAGSGANPEEFIQQVRDVSGLLVEKEVGVYEFAHLSFQEYLAAVQIKESNQENLLIRNINQSWWAETIRLYAAQSNASNLIRAVLAMPSPSVKELALAYDCLEEGLSVNPDVRQQLEQILEQGLNSTDPEIAKLAAQVQLSRRLK